MAAQPSSALCVPRKAAVLVTVLQALAASVNANFSAPQNDEATFRSCSPHCGALSLVRRQSSLQRWSLSRLPLAMRGRGSALGLAAASGLEPLLDLSNTQYCGVVNIGTPTQMIWVLMDTGSSDLWVRRSTFHAALSSTAHSSGEEVSIQYGQGGVSGEIYTDRVSMGGVELASQHFLLPNMEVGMDTVAAAGVLGLALPGLSHTGDTILEHLKQDAGISAFRLFLTGTAEGSFLAFGLPDASWFANHTVTWAPSTTNMWWDLPAALRVGGQDLVSGTCILDSGTSYLAAPRSAFLKILDKLLPNRALHRCRVEDPAEAYQCPCDVIDDVQTLEVQVGGTTFPVRPDQLLVPVNGNKCVLQLVPTSEEMPIILGDTFLRTVYAIFDAEGPRIGLAARSGTPGDARPEPPRLKGPLGSLPLWLQRPWFLWTVAGILFLASLLTCLAVPYLHATRRQGNTIHLQEGVVSSAVAPASATPYRQL